MIAASLNGSVHRLHFHISDYFCGFCTMWLILQTLHSTQESYISVTSHGAGVVQW